MYKFEFDDEDWDMYEIIYSENPVEIMVDDSFERHWSPFPRRPYYQMRGKRITEQQAFDIISKTDRIFHNILYTGEHLEKFKSFDSYIWSMNFDNNWFLESFPYRCG